MLFLVTEIYTGNIYLWKANNKTMTVQDYKVSISGLLFDVEDIVILEACFNLLEKHLMVKKAKNKRKVVGYTPSGDPITVAQLEKEVLAAIERVRSGQGIRHEDLIKEMSTW